MQGTQRWPRAPTQGRRARARPAVARGARATLLG